VPPCLDVYVWVTPPDRAEVLSHFIDRYVDAEDPGDPRLNALVRTFISAKPAPGDRQALEELRRGDKEGPAFSIYLHARNHHETIITITEEGAVVLGIGLDASDSSPQIEDRAAALLTTLMAEFKAQAGVAGVELAPPQSATEWAEEDLAQLRLGSL
jgi:hypothetical protein